MEFARSVYFPESHTQANARIFAFPGGARSQKEKELRRTMKKMTRLLREKLVVQATN